MMTDFYSYLQEEDDNDIVAYSFKTVNGSLYYVYFDPYEYNGYTEVYPNLLNLGFGLGFSRASKSQNDNNSDPRVGVTISKIVSDFIEEKGTEVVLLFHCDHSDGKQKGRDKIFLKWYQVYNSNNSVLMRRMQVNGTDARGNEMQLFLGYLTPVNNPHLIAVGEEFDHFAEQLTYKS